MTARMANVQNRNQGGCLAGRGQQRADAALKAREHRQPQRPEQDVQPQRRRALALKEQIWTRTWHRAKPGEKLRLKYKEFL